MRILLIAPLPPPISGHSLASEVLLDDLSKSHNVEVVNLSWDCSTNGRAVSNRVFEVAKILTHVWRKRKDPGVIYFTISESLLGNVKDLLIYLVCWKSLSKMYIHLHGGSIKRLLFDRHTLLSYLNKTFIQRLAGVIISGEAHLPIFNQIIPQKKIHIVPNFASNDLFVSEEQIIEKFSKDQPLRILYLSGLERKKGYTELADAYLKLDGKLKGSIQIDFAGRFYDSEADKKVFLEKINGAGQIHYHGVIDNSQKRKFFLDAHIFCLPTTHLEGQPISILEAYASGCVVLTTCPPGILDVFTAGVNGFGIRNGSADSIKMALEKVFENPKGLLKIAINNRRTAGEKYRTTSFNARLRAIIETPISPLPLKLGAEV
jgi:glycosyltransferase involved in cell wall biosynthesis